MPTNGTIEPLQQKTWQLDEPSNGIEGHLYYCLLCDEVLVLSKQEVHPRKIWLVFNDVCPGCGFQLQNVLGYRPSILPAGRRLLTNLKCADPKVFLEPDTPIEQVRRGSTLSRDLESHITTGIETIDKTLALKRGQFAYLQGEQSHSLSLLLCVRATLPPPHGLDSDVVFVDAGNLFDSYAITQHTINLGLQGANVEKRIHLSRAFTHHQVYNLVMDKLDPAVQHYNAGLAVVSDITALFCDPDVQDKKESLDIFRKSLCFLAEIAERRKMVILATSVKTRSKTMEEALSQTAHVSAEIKDKDTCLDFKIREHSFTHSNADEPRLDNGMLPGYFR